MIARSADKYEAFINAVKQRYAPFEYQGLESYIVYHDLKVLKVFKWFVVANMSFEEESHFLAERHSRLSVYAPDITANIVWLATDGEITEDRQDAYASALLMTIGESFLHSTWKCAQKAEQYRLAEGIGKCLAKRHRLAPRCQISSSDFNHRSYRWFIEASNLLFSSELSTKILPDAHSALSDKIEAFVNSHCPIPASGDVALIHGDLNLSNIVISRKEPQFVDPGPALLVGAGVEDPSSVILDEGWDVALMAKHFLENGGPPARTAFITGYLKESKLDPDSFGCSLIFWETYCFLLVAALSCRRYKMFQDESNPFNSFLKSKKVTINKYISYCFSKVLINVELEPIFPAFINNNAVEIFC